jgi:hypothetical protein
MIISGLGQAIPGRHGRKPDRQLPALSSMLPGASQVFGSGRLIQPIEIHETPVFRERFGANLASITPESETRPFVPLYPSGAEHVLTTKTPLLWYMKI